MAYTPPPWMQMDVPKFGSLAPNNVGAAMSLYNMNRPQPAAGAAPGGQQPGAGGLLGALSSAMQGNPQGGLAKQLFGGGQPMPQAGPMPGGPTAPPQMGMLGGLMQKLGGMGGMFGGAGGGAPPMGGAGGGGLTPTALSGLW